MSSKQKLELTWIGKDVRTRIEPRILVPNSDLGHFSSSRPATGTHNDNMLIYGDNLLAIKALEHGLAGQVKCVFIDPPYNTGSAFDHYDDGVEHSIWLSLMRARLEVLHDLISQDGSIWITIDDNECHYLKVLCDEIFGRKNYVGTIIWQKIYTVKNSARHFSEMHDYILVYAKNKERWTRNLLPRTDELDTGYTNPDNDPRGPWTTNAIQARNYYSQGQYEIECPDGRKITPPRGTYWRISEESFEKLKADNRVWWGAKGTAVPRIKKFLSEAKRGIVPASLWLHKDAGQNAEAKQELRKVLEEEDLDELFLTPKPEKLIKRVLEIATQPGDLVLDSFAGSGTTGAVAHKMGRRWIMVELGEHCHTHIIPRMKKVIDGEDPGGITEAVGWKGGGGFRYYKLGPSLITQDQWGREIIAPEYRQNTAMLIEAMCKLHGYTFKPSDTHFWMHGQSTEADFIYVTTESLSKDQVAFISEEVGDERSLLICCGSHRLKDPAQFANITVTKIPKSVLEKCEWGKDDYSLKIRNLPLAEDVPAAIPEAEQEEAKQDPPRRKRGRPRKTAADEPNQMTLFDAGAKEGK